MSARDYIDVKSWILDDDMIPSMLQDFNNRYQMMDLHNEKKKGTSVYNGIFNLLVLQGARDWMTGNLPQHGDLDDHHIVPSSRAKDNLKEINVHTILNRTPLTAETNRQVISDRLPNEYLPELISHNGKDQVQAIFESHFISNIAFEILLRDPFGPDDYEIFISERKRTIIEAIENLLIKDRFDMSPQIRAIDKNVENTEIGIRNLIVKSLYDDFSCIPQHIAVKLEERIQRLSKKNPMIDLEKYQKLSEIIEYADLRDLQDIITSKVTWERFEPRFINKENLNIKFNQLSELRNGIRHSRTVDEITRKEGEAAILWFKQVLNI